MHIKRVAARRASWTASAATATAARRSSPERSTRWALRAVRGLLPAALLLAGELPAVGQDVHGDLQVLGQVRDGYFTNKTETPTDIYGLAGADRILGGASMDTYFRLERDFARDTSATNLLAGYFKVPWHGIELTGGRQFLAETPGGVYAADAGKIRVDTGGPIALTIFGGQPQYVEPTYGAPNLSQDEQIFGGSLRTTRLGNGTFGLSFMDLQRQGRTLKQLCSATGAYTFAALPGRPSTYGVVAYDADYQNLDQVTAGLNSFLGSPRLTFNFESGYYKPQDKGNRLVTNPNRREDPIYQIFSVSQLLQFRGGLRYALSKSLSAFGDYSYQRYDQLDSYYNNGNVASTGLMWLPGGDGLELVRLEYYLVDASTGGNVNGGRLSYENRFYRNIVFRTKFDVSVYEKVTNVNSTAFNSFLSLGYELRPGVLAEVNMEGNTNNRFDEDFRFGFYISYRFRTQSGKGMQTPAVSDPRQDPTALYAGRGWGRPL